MRQDIFHPFRLAKFLHPSYKGFADKGIPAAEDAVGKLVADQEWRREPIGRHGQLLVATENTTQNIIIAIIDPATGMQVGYAQAGDVTHLLAPTSRKQKPIYTTEFVIHDDYRGLGFGGLARTYVENLLADRHPNGILLGDTIQAYDVNSRRAMGKILDTSGAQTTELSEAVRRTRHEDWVFKTLDHSQSNLPWSLTIDNVTFLAPNGTNFSLPDKFEVGEDRIIQYDGLQVGIVSDKGIKLLRPGSNLTSEGYDRDHDHWDGVGKLWSSLIACGLRPKIDNI